MEKRVLSVVVPLYNEEENLAPLYKELCEIFTSMTFFNDYEIVFVNDGSRDASLLVLKHLANHDTHIKVVSFTRNFGHESATLAGIRYASGDAVVLIDADRQDPAELILEFEKEIQKGYHIIFGQRVKRLNESWLKKCTSKMFYPFFKWITGVDMPRDVGDFCMLSRKAVDLLKQFGERTVFIRGLIYWIGLPKKAVPFIRRSRGAGNSKYDYAKLCKFAIENIISFSTTPIYLIMSLSLFVISMCVAGAVIAFCMYLFGYVVMTGWTSLMMGMLFLSASMLFCFSIVGLYVGKIFQEVKQRPVFLVDELINIEHGARLFTPSHTVPGQHSGADAHFF
jgi:polyisoprenyl-phosphate glycosyltransferase